MINFNPQVSFTGKLPKYDRYISEYERLKPQVIELLEQGLSNIQIANAIGKQNQWVAAALNHYQRLSNHAMKTMTVEEKIIKMKRIGVAKENIAKKLGIPLITVEKVCRYTRSTTNAKLIFHEEPEISMAAREIISLFDNGISLSAISQEVNLPENEIKEILHRNKRYTEDTFEYVKSIKDPDLAKSILKLKLPKDVLENLLKDLK